MDRLTRFLLFLVYGTTTASCQGDVTAAVGGSVLLPCVYSGPEPVPEQVTFFWRDGDNGRVMNVVSGKQDVVTQSTAFAGRVSSFPDLYGGGNFSIQLRDVRRSDGGPYECHVLTLDVLRQVSLTVSGRDEAAEPPGPLDGAAPPAGASLSILLLSVLLSFMSSALTWSR
ncbi:V-set domain-containing T-cell activation inhibitor 1-like [Pempheris klunzingeri]|uniref:V-set domain-containing T-cell activation inhibitor 1-like n=1 Tax=Pempheris klunzingeri TaxID=3127111 RepID=UPI0039806BEB